MATLPGAYWSATDFVFKRGDDVVRTVTLSQLDPLDSTQTVPVDITDWTFRAQIRSTVTSDAKYPFDCNVDDGPGGTVSIRMSRDTTELLEPGRYVWDFEITDGGNKRLTRMDGKARVVADVTRDDGTSPIPVPNADLDLAAETAAREAADNSLDNRLDTVEGDLTVVAADATTETVARQNADDALDIRLAAVEATTEIVSSSPGGALDVDLINYETAGDIALNNLNWVAVLGTDLRLAASDGDYIQVTISGFWDNGAVNGNIDVATINTVTHTTINWFSSAAGSAAAGGSVAWTGPGSQYFPFSGATTLRLVTADVMADSHVTLRLLARCANGSGFGSKKLLDPATYPIQMTAVNLGPGAP